MKKKKNFISDSIFLDIDFCRWLTIIFNVICRSFNVWSWFYLLIVESKNDSSRHHRMQSSKGSILRRWNSPHRFQWSNKHVIQFIDSSFDRNCTTAEASVLLCLMRNCNNVFSFYFCSKIVSYDFCKDQKQNPPKVDFHPFDTIRLQSVWRAASWRLFLTIYLFRFTVYFITIFVRLRNYITRFRFEFEFEFQNPSIGFTLWELVVYYMFGL